jgi:hypothetical protein
LDSNGFLQNNLFGNLLTALVASAFVVGVHKVSQMLREKFLNDLKVGSATIVDTKLEPCIFGLARLKIPSQGPKLIA